MREPMVITFPGGDRVDASYRGRRIFTDQQGETPRPFDLFLASIGTCAGIYIAKFCEKRGISTDEVRLLQHTTVDPETRMVTSIDLEVELPADFPARYKPALLNAAKLCSVKKHLDEPPKIDVRVAEEQHA